MISLIPAPDSPDRRISAIVASIMRSRLPRPVLVFILTPYLDRSIYYSIGVWLMQRRRHGPICPKITSRGIFMQFTKFGRTGLSVSRLCLGTGTFGKQTDEAESFRVFDKATDAGVNFIDTADVYPGGADLPEVGRSEEITGLWLKGKRSRFILGTKAGGRMGSSPWDQGSSRKHLLDAIEAS